jgi:glycerol-3-phosphate acyltransferase PlsX
MKNREIILDGMGGDHAPEAIVEGAVRASVHINHTIRIVGDEQKVLAELERCGYDPQKIKVVHADDAIGGEEAPVKAVRTKQNSSMVIGLNMLKRGEGGVFISAGNTGALMAGGLFILGRIQGIDRPLLASAYPVLKNGGVSLLVDSGANAECKPNNLLEFATMGAIYAEKVLGVKQPTVGLVNIGTEETKGTTVLKAAYELLQKSRDYGGVNFIGNVEAREIPAGAADVLVCDGFVGNVVLKLTEGVAWNIFKLIRNKFKEGAVSKLGAMLLAGKLKELKDTFDYSEYGGAPILGVRGALVKMHGSSNANAVKNTILKAIPYMENGVVQHIENAVLELEAITSSE